MTQHYCAAGGKLDPTAVSVQSGKTYEQEFAPEIERAQVWQILFFTYHKRDNMSVWVMPATTHMCLQTGKSKTTPWGSGYRPAPPLLHGMIQARYCKWHSFYTFVLPLFYV